MALSTSERAFAIEAINLLVEDSGEPCVDNFRMADADDSEEIGLYEEAARRGCCGSHDGEVTHPETGKRILIGYNYGH